jgi:hypothetical protein
MFDTSNSKLKLMSNIELDFFRSQEGLLFDARRSAKFQNGGADRDRTGGLLVANQALSQLSYSPTDSWWAWVELNYRPHPYQGCALAT